MAIYWVLFSSASLASLLHLYKESRDFQLLVFILLFAFILSLASLRFASIDYSNYESLFNTTSFKDFSFPFYSGSYGTTGKEFLWATFSSVFSCLGLSFQLWLFFIALTSISIKFYFFIRFTPYFLLAIAIYITHSFVKDMGQIRNGLSGAILLFSILPIINRDLKKFVITVSIAFGVQAFAIIALPIYWLYPIFKKSKYSLIIILMALSLLSLKGGISEIIISNFSSIGVVPEQVVHKIEGYASYEMEMYSILSVTGITFVIISILSILVKDKFDNRSSLFAVFSMLHFYGVSLFLLFTGINTLSNRSLDLFSLTALPFLFTSSMLFTKGFTRVLFMVLIISYCALRLYANIGGFNPYMTIFSYSLPEFSY